MTYTISTIGSTEKVDFPRLGYFSVPAKIDTGADSSAIWATNIAVTPEGLRFTLFGEGSRHYTGEPLTVTDYRTAAVRNSAGNEELRFKVRLSVRIGKRNIAAWFNLADRSRMRYPVLLGRRLLKGKFVVDVSQRKGAFNATRPAHVLILASASDHPRMKGLAGDLVKHMKTKAQVVVRPYTSLAFSIATGDVVVREMTTGQDIADFDLVYFKSHRRYYEFAISLAQYLAFKQVPFIDEALSQHVSYDKLSELMTLALAGQPVPPVFCAGSEILKQQFSAVHEGLGSKVVCKEINADRGRKNYLISSQKELNDVLASRESDDVFLVQRYIENDGYIRAYVLGTQISLAVKRTPVRHAEPRKQHLNNPAGGKNTKLLDGESLPSVVRDLAIRSSSLMNRQIAGVDLIQDKNTKEWFVLEVNSAPQLVSGSFLPQKRVALAKFIDFELNR